ncbi:hypothetical protein M409DRAFT_17327 [Zasmidium cellare ATCC 36951]|uniref:H-type lectin domain-containing protein n=1 Tax=Zasmidium cellare ATCC 36951 TaxID=1080233 RepID=A0A6A6CYG6_ZASCE|nr:uncharacterized protein M409DRAFT_17327 [Zasmidium cellare ATCC 36951]KAF2172085.1 hypothetical protein M409DRAFT_17327 [Zasmidium cellare ATCC 36951]
MPGFPFAAEDNNVHLSKPGVDNGHFCTSEVRPRKKATASTSRTIALPKDRYKAPPNLAAGFTSLDISCERSIRANIIADSITTTKFRIGVETWGTSRLLEASAVWIEHKADAKDCVFGQFDTKTNPMSRLGSPTKGGTLKRTNTQPGELLPQKHAKPFFFPKPFSEPPEVVCWLNRLDLTSGPDYDYKIRAFADEINTESFLAHINTWDNGRMPGAALCWIAFPKGKKNVDSGRFSTKDVRKRTNPRPKTTSRIKFKKRFEKAPTVLAAITMMDAAGNADLRIKLNISNVDKDGFTWTFETWDDSTLYAASAHWIALGSTIQSRSQVVTPT